MKFSFLVPVKELVIRRSSFPRNRKKAFKQGRYIVGQKLFLSIFLPATEEEEEEKVRAVLFLIQGTVFTLIPKRKVQKPRKAVSLAENSELEKIERTNPRAESKDDNLPPLCFKIKRKRGRELKIYRTRYIFLYENELLPDKSWN